MNWNNWIRQFHRWLSIAFTLAVIANFVAMAHGQSRRLGGLLAAAPAVPAAVHRPVHVRAAVCRQVARRRRPADRSEGDGRQDVREGEGRKEGRRQARRAKPVLLSGGNPQIAKGYGDAPVQAYIAAMPGWKRDVGRRLDALIERTVPGVRKAVKWNSPFYGVEGRAGSSAFMLHEVREGDLLPRRVAASAPARQVRSTRTCATSTSTRTTLDEAQFAAWVKQASQLPGENVSGATDSHEESDTTMKKSGANASKSGSSPSQLIDAKIEELGDWRGETLARVRALIKQADPEVVEEWKWRGRSGVGARRHHLHRRDLQGLREADLRQGRGAGRPVGPVQRQPRRQRHGARSISARATRSTRRR